MKRFTDIVASILPNVEELFPWDAQEMLEASAPAPMILDVREPDEYNAMHIEGSLLVPRGILETACEYGYEDTHPKVARARKEPIVVVCRSGNRSVLAAHTMKIMGYQNVYSLKTGLRGWNDYELPLVDKNGMVVPVEIADRFFTTRLRPDQIDPEKRIT